MLTIGIILYNEEKRLQCVEQNIALMRASGVSCIVVDNASTDTTRASIARLVENFGVEAVYRTENHMAAARGQVIELAQTPWVGFIDADCRIDQQWLDTALARIAENSAPSALGGPLTPGGKKNLMYKSLFKSFLGNINSAQVKNYTESCGVDHLPTANVLYRRQDVIDAGNFNLKKVRVGEDLDMSYRLKSRGKLLFMDPALALEHDLPERLTTWIKKVFNYGRARGEVAVEHSVLFTYPFLLPFLFFIFLIGLIVLLVQGREFIVGVAVLVYLSVVFINAVYYGRRHTLQLFLNLIAMHVAYSCGLFVGLFKDIEPVSRTTH